ncbi:hypothetical protein [uncultured Devosia sp.]|uniref:hypothetical protein n=1 Tax=uncultured Devosia sp. TaxID=211434 RepID=UPI0035CB55A6
MIHFFGILEPGARRHVSAAEAPNKTSFFTPADPIAGRDAALSPAELDALILNGKQPEDGAEDRRFTYSLALHSW